MEWSAWCHGSAPPGPCPSWTPCRGNRRSYPIPLYHLHIIINCTSDMWSYSSLPFSANLDYLLGAPAGRYWYFIVRLKLWQRVTLYPKGSHLTVTCLAWMSTTWSLRGPCIGSDKARGQEEFTGNYEIGREGGIEGETMRR